MTKRAKQAPAPPLTFPSRLSLVAYRLPSIICMFLMIYGESVRDAFQQRLWNHYTAAGGPSERLGRMLGNNSSRGVRARFDGYWAVLSICVVL